MATVAQWLEERTLLTNEIGSGAISRAQGYYDSLSVMNQQVQEFARQQDEVDLVSGHYDIAVKNLSMAEAAFHAFLTGAASGDLPDTVWEQMVPLSQIAPTFTDVTQRREFRRFARSQAPRGGAENRGAPKS